MDVMLMARNYNLWPWVGRASETLQNHGFQQAISEGVFGQRLLCRLDSTPGFDT